MRQHSGLLAVAEHLQGQFGGQLFALLASQLSHDSLVGEEDGGGDTVLMASGIPVDGAICDRRYPGWHRHDRLWEAGVSDEVAARHGCHPLRGVATYGDVYRLTYVRGPSGIIVMLAEELKKS